MIKHNMKRILGVLLMAMMCIAMQAQTMKVCYVAGNVTQTVKGKKVAINVNASLTKADQVTIPYEGKLELLDEVNKKRVILKVPGTGKISDLMKASNNSVMELTDRYVTYVKKQMTNKGLASKQRMSDFATVTRKKASLEEEKKDPFASLEDELDAFSSKDFSADFDEFKSDVDRRYREFRDSINRVFIEAVRAPWKKTEQTAAVERPKDHDVKPQVYTADDNTTAGIREFGKRLLKSIGIKSMDKKKKEEVSSTAKPVAEIQPVVLKEDVEDGQKEYTGAGMPFMFFGTEMSVRLDETRRLNVGTLTSDRVADALEHLSSPYYDNVLYDCLQLKKQYDLCDWAYLLMLKTITDQFCGEGTNEAALLMGYLYYQSGYKVKYGMAKDKLYLLVASKHQIYDKSSYYFEDTFYYPMEDIDGILHICQAKFPQEQGISLFIAKEQKFTNPNADGRTIVSKRYKDVKINVAVNKNLIDFYDTYPSSCIDGDFTTRWVMYAETPMNVDVKAQIYPVLQSKLEGLSELDAVNRLLNFVQTGLEYEYDEVVWGQDRPFFAEESLYYPYCDCEDRSVLFTRLVRDLLGLECALIYYPGHLAAAVHFNTDVKGDAYELNGKDYTVCDPTYIGAPVGMQMPDFRDGGATLISIK